MYLMTACGGSSPVFQSQQPAIGGDDVTPSTTEEAVIIPLLGSGQGNDSVNGQLNLPTERLSAGSEVTVSASLVDSETKAWVTSQSYDVVISSPCLIAGRARVSSNSMTISDGQISYTYQATGCVGQDIITLAVSHTSQTDILVRASGALDIASAIVNQVSQDSISSQQLGSQEPSNPVLPRQAVINFKVIDRFGNPVEGTQVNFVLSNPGIGAELATGSANTNDAGIATARLNSGRGVGVLRVTATIAAEDGDAITGHSSPISITTGFLDSDSFNIAVDKRIVWGGVGRTQRPKSRYLCMPEMLIKIELLTEQS